MLSNEFIITHVKLPRFSGSPIISKDSSVIYKAQLSSSAMPSIFP